MISTDPQVWIGAILIILSLTFLFKNTILYRIVETTIVGGALGHVAILAIKNIRELGIERLPANPLLAVPIIAGLLLFTRLHKTQYWLSRYGMAMLVGVGTGVTMRSMVDAQLLAQIRSTLIPLTSIDNVIIVVSVVCTTLYFIFTSEYKGIIGAIRKVGLWFMMIAFGVSVGAGLIGRLAYVITVIRFLLSNWLGLIQ